MFLHTGSGEVVKIADLIAVVDIEYYKGPIDNNLKFKPKSAIVTTDKTVFSKMSSTALTRRLREVVDIFYRDRLLVKK